MARYIGPTCKLARREGADLSLKRPARALDSKCKLEQKPGQHGAVCPQGQAVRLRHPAAREAEGQAHLRLAGASVPQLLQEGCSTQEGQHRREPAAAARDRASTTSSTAWASRSPVRPARQLVSHRASLVNGKSVNLPSYQVKAGDAIAAVRARPEAAARAGSAEPSPSRWICRRAGSKSMPRSSPACSRRFRIAPTCLPTSTKR